MGRPLLLEGEAGTGKTALAAALAELLEAPLIRLQCYEGIDASQALYDWDFPRQLLHLRASEVAEGSARSGDVERLEGELYTRRFLLARPLLQALETTPSVLLIDEVDRADDEFEAFLLEVLSEYSVSIPELGTVRAEVPPVVVLTSNRTRELHDALKRRCFYHWLEHPSVEREVAILRARLPEVSERLARQVAVAAAGAARGGAGQGARGRGESRLGPCVARARRGGARPGVGGGDARRGAEVPRGPGPSGRHGLDSRAQPVSEPADPLVAIAGFGRVLRAAGVGADAGRIAAFTAALGCLDGSRREDVYWAGRLTLCADPDELPRYDAAFEAVFGGASPSPLPPREPPAPIAVAPAPAAGDPGPSAAGDEADRERLYASASADGSLTPQGLCRASRPPTRLRWTGCWRRSRCPVSDARRAVTGPLPAAGSTAAARSTRRSRRAARRPGWRTASPARGRDAWCCCVDVSGSMAPYADALLRFAHAARRGSSPVEVFTLGTRLTRVTRELTHRDPETAMRAVLAAVPDWSGGTRLGVLVRDFLDTWGQRGLARGAVVVILSDGWEREDPALLGEQMGRLHRLAHRLVWANPLRDRPGYAPLAAGMAAALPNVDDFVAGHSVAALEELAGVVAGRADNRSRTRAAALAGHPMRWGQSA